MSLIFWTFFTLLSLAGGLTSALHELTTPFSEYDRPDPGSESKGHCPYQPGELNTRVSDFDYKKLAGVWKVVYDEKELNDNFTCSGIRFDLYDDQPTDYRNDEENDFLAANQLNILQLKSSHGLTQKFRSELSA